MFHWRLGSFSLRQGSAERQRKMANSLLGGQLFSFALQWTFPNRFSASPAAFVSSSFFVGEG